MTERRTPAAAVGLALLLVALAPAPAASAARVQRLAASPRAEATATLRAPSSTLIAGEEPSPPAVAPAGRPAPELGPPAPGSESPTTGTPGAATDPATAQTDPAADAEDNVHGTSNDLLADNGLRSPWCEPGRRLNPLGRRNCENGGLASSGAGGDNASFDRHVDTSSWTGAPKVDRWFISIVLTILSFAWTVMVTLTRGVFTALEFAFSFNPLDPSHRGTLAATLDHQVHAVTRPLALILAPAGAIWLMWSTTVARRPGHAASHALLSCLLIVGALIVLANPIGTVGAALTASQQVGLAVIGATAGEPSAGAGATVSGLQAMADGVIDQPLALLEFGDVDWGTNPRRLDPHLREAAMTLARNESPEKVAAVRAARSNLDLVQVWPANSTERNSINDPGSLLRVLCGSDRDTKCTAATGRFAEFRTERGAWQRALGLVVILLGLIPFWIALTFVAVRVISAGLMATVRLIQLSFLTPLALVGAHGNRRLTTFAGDLAGNVLSAAAYSFFLGLIMLVWRLITTWPGYGFVMQWLLLTIALWQLIAHRRSLWGTAHAPGSAAKGVGGQVARYAATSVALKGGIRAARIPRQGGRAALGSARRLGGMPAAAVRRTRQQQAGGRPALPVATGAARVRQPEGAGPPEPADGSGAAPSSASHLDAAVAGTGGPMRAEAARRLVGEQNQRMAIGVLAHRLHVADAADLPSLRVRRARVSGELARITEAVPKASGRERAALVRRQQSLTGRRDQVQAQVNRAEQSSYKARAAQDDPGRDRAILARRLDQQAGLPRGAFGSGERRQYPQLAALAGAAPHEYRAASPGGRLRMRADIDRELQRRTHARQALAPHNTAARQTGNEPSAPRERKPADGSADVGEGTTGPATRAPGRRAAATSQERRRAFRRQAGRED